MAIGSNDDDDDDREQIMLSAIQSCVRTLRREWC